MRIIVIIMAVIVGKTPKDYYTVRPCAMIDHIYGGNQTRVLRVYPVCSAYYSGADPSQHVPVPVGVAADGPERIASAINTSFGASAYLAFLLHALAVELYLRLTPAETERLRRVSYERQKEAGMKNPGNAGLTAQRLGDADPWSLEPPQSGSNGSTDEKYLRIARRPVPTERGAARLSDPESEDRWSSPTGSRSVLQL